MQIYSQNNGILLLELRVTVPTFCWQHPPPPTEKKMKIRNSKAKPAGYKNTKIEKNYVKTQKM